MNKAAFLNIVRQVAPIQDQEVDDLERLVVSFPYCQTAHVLLAKAAHDRGSMLSTQKLRRAAAHVSNRQLLKQLVYASPAMEEVPVMVEDEAEQEVEIAHISEPFYENEPQNNFEETEEQDIAEHEEEQLVSESVAFVDEEVDPFADLQEEATDYAYSEEEQEELALEPTSEAGLTDAFQVADTLETESPAEEPQGIIIDETAAIEETYLVSQNEETEQPTAEETLNIESYTSEEEVIPVAVISEVEQPEVEEEPALGGEIDLSEDEDNLDELLELIQISSLSSINLTTSSQEEIILEPTSASELGDREEEFPVPVNVDSSLPPQVAALVSPEEDPGLSAYLQIAELDSLYDTSGYEFPTLKLPEVVQGTASVDEASQDPYLSIFTQNNLAYWMGSSRLGESIQLKDEWTSEKPFYFQPELILEHVKGKNAPAPAPEVTPAAKLDMQLDIINQFLKTTPKRKTLANAQLSQEPQEDLSAKSSKIKKTLVSENLALIFIKQGKGKKAIKIYEQLIVKFPEKKSYFAEQIEKLRNE